MAEQSRRPAFQFYPADWRKDPELQTCSLLARGLWIEMLCVMHEAEPYGHLCVNGRPLTNEQLARLVGETPATVRKLTAELEAAGVPSRTDEGVLYSRRMVKDEANRVRRGAGGHLSLRNPNVPRPRGQKDGEKDTLKDTFQGSFDGSSGGSPSSSSSSTDLPSGDGPAQAQAPTRTREAKRRAGPLPADWAPNDTHRRIAADERRDLNREVQNFRDHAAANGRLQVDWNAAFCTWLRSPYGRDGGPGGTALAVQPSLIPSVDRTAALIDASRAEKDAQAAWMNRISTAFAALEEDERAAIEQAAAARPKVAATAGTPAYRTVLRIAMLRIYGEKVGDPRPEVVDG